MNFDVIYMKFNKKIRVGISILCLLLIFTTSISLIDFDQKNSVVDESSLSISASEDFYEPNDTRFSAYNLTDWEDTWLSTINGLGTQLNDDFYEIFIKPGFTYLKVDLIFNNSEGNIDIIVRSNTGTYIVGNSTFTDNEFIDFLVPGGGRYYLEIYGANLGNNYDLTWKVDDHYEPNDIPSQAYDISGNRGWRLDWIDGPGRQLNDDWYSFTVNPGDGRIIFDLWFNHYEGNIDIALYDDPHATNVYSSTSMYDNELINYTLPVITVPTTYYIKIYYGNQGNHYNFWFNIFPLEDQYDFPPNDVWMNAVDISGNETINHMGIQADDDWYKVYVDWNETRLQVDVFHNDFFGNIKFEIFYYDYSNPYNNLVAWTDSEQIYINVPWSGWYYIHIYGDNTGNQYDLRWVSSVPGEDNYEPNNDVTQAKWLFMEDTPLFDGFGIQFDEDWYRIDNIENHVYVEVEFLHPLTNQELEIWYEDTPGVYVILAGTYLTGDYLFIDIDLPKFGTYYILVSGSNLGTEYDLRWKREGSLDDYFEVNDNYWNATQINPNYYPDLWIVDDNEDWFSLYLNPGDMIDVYIYFDHLEGDLELELYDPNVSNNPRIGSYSVDNEEKITYTVDISGDWRIRVFHAFGDSRVYYDLDIWVNGGGDDQYEENDLAVDAHDLTSYEGLWIRGMQFDVDWFKFDVGEGVENLIVELIYNDYEGDINIELIDSFSNIVGHSNDRTGREYIEITNPLSGTYYIRIHGQGFENWYDLYWSGGGEVFYGDDFYEDNDEMHKAYGLWNDEQTWLSDIGGLAVQGNDDWYMIDVTPHFQNIIVELAFNYSQGEINFELYNDVGNNVGVGGNATINRNLLSLNVTVGDWGEYFINVWGDNFENEYDLWWDDIRTNFREDAYEQNDNNVNATNLSEDRKPGRHNLTSLSGFGVQYDQDWFEIFVRSGQSLPCILIVEIFYDSAEGLMGFEVYDDDLKRIVGNFTLEDNDFVAYRIRSNGTYYIKVFGDNTGNVYNLRWKTKDDIPIEEIPGYDILILLGSIFGVASIIVIKWKRSKFNRK